ncbi:MAG: hypothetical protein IPN72_05720 [Saprospiraceae bacterium]|nr:hypothetical protein [Saprospiraceae bacterium]
MKRINQSFIVFFSTLFLVLIFAIDIQAQRTPTTTRTSRRTTRDTEPSPSFTENLNYEIKVGNIGFGGNTFGLAVKGNVGYKVFEKLSAGVGLRTNFTYLNYPTGLQDESGFDFGGFGYLRGKITKTIYLQAEYGYQSFATFNGAGGRISAYTPLVGGGYMNGGDRWSYGAEVLFNINDRAQDINGIIEYWINFSYNF